MVPMVPMSTNRLQSPSKANWASIHRSILVLEIVILFLNVSDISRIQQFWVKIIVFGCIALHCKPVSQRSLSVSIYRYIIRRRHDLNASERQSMKGMAAMEGMRCRFLNAGNRWPLSAWECVRAQSRRRAVIAVIAAMNRFDAIIFIFNYRL